MHKDRVFQLAKGFRGRAKNCVRIARERVEKSLQYAYRDRKAKKRDMRSLWIQRINAGAREHGVSNIDYELYFLVFDFVPEVTNICVACCAAHILEFYPWTSAGERADQ